MMVRDRVDVDDEGVDVDIVVVDDDAVFRCFGFSMSIF